MAATEAKSMRRRIGRRFWIGVASRDHARRGVAGGFAQLGHGKRAPLARMAAGDWIVYYSPRTQFGGGEPYQRFTAIGQVEAGEIYRLRTSRDFVPYRRAVRFLRGGEAPIHPLLPQLGFIKDTRRWGYLFRRGHFEITEEDFRLIAAAMGVDPAIGDTRSRRVHTRFRTPRESPGFLLWLVTNSWQRQLRAALDPLDLTHVQFVLLASLAWLPRSAEAVTQARLAQQARTDVMMTSQVVRALERKGFLVRGVYPTDQRARRLHITPKGLHLVNRALRLVERADAKFFGAAGRDLPKLVALLRALSAR